MSSQEKDIWISVEIERRSHMDKNELSRDCSGISWSFPRKIDESGQAFGESIEQVISEQSLRRFFADHLGMFVHWGLFSVTAGVWKGQQLGQYELGEGIIRTFRIPIAEYKDLTKQFKPKDTYADDLVLAAKAAGMRYLVITAKHCDGFCLFRSKVNNYNAFDAIGRDLVQELADACRRHDLKLGLYYNHTLDCSEEHAPGSISASGVKLETPLCNDWDFPDNDRKDYKIFLHKKVMPQVRELLTQYGDILLMWFDFPHNITPEQCHDLYDLVKSIQPDCLVNSRIGNIVSDYYDLGDNQIPTIPMDVPQECLVTLNDTWGYKVTDHNWKEPGQIIDMIARSSECGANLLVNVGPMSDGSLTPETDIILQAVSAWVSRNREAVYNTRRNPFRATFDWGHLASAEDKLYLFMQDGSQRNIEINGLLSQIVQVTGLPYHNPVNFIQTFEPDGRLCTQISILASCLEKPVYCIRCAESILIDDSLLQHGDSLRLHPAWAQKITASGQDQTSAAIEKEINVFDRYNGKRGLAVNRIAVVAGWKSKDEYLQWQAAFTKPGTYQMQLVTQPGDHIGHPLSGVAIELDNSNAGHQMTETSILAEDRCFQVSKTGKENSRVASLCGTCHIDVPGLHTVRLKRLYSYDVNIPMVWLQFDRLS
jgi:alpha-L-fucosidase